MILVAAPAVKLALVVGVLDQIFFCNPVVLESICYRKRAKRLKYQSNTTEGLRKIWTGSNIMISYGRLAAT